MRLLLKLSSAIRKSIRRGARALRSDTRGVAAVEFALFAPLGLLLLYGEFVVGETVSISRKVVITGHSIADLIAQNSSLSASQVDTFLNASAQIAAPYPTSGMTIVVAELYTNASNVTTVSWSRPLNATALTMGARFPLPAGIGQPTAYLIYARVTYSYSPTVGSHWFGVIPLSYTYYISPRNSASVTLTN
jgi:Flp pilus assembly protein TadG